MRLAHTTKRPRGGFTLVELLVVITIILVLVGLTATAVFKYMGEGPKLQARNDISQLSDALGTFKAKFGFYPPSQIKLGFRPGSPYYGSTQLDADSIACIQKMFPRAMDTWATQGIAWYPGMNAQSPAVVLHGDQCLVFFLGGVEGWGPNGTSPYGCSGFSANPANPMLPPQAASETRIGPFYDFKGSQLSGPYIDNGTTRNGPLTQNPPIGGFLVYKDPWGTPYAYFSSGKTKNGYNAYGGSDCPVNQPLPPASGILQPPTWAYLQKGAFYDVNPANPNIPVYYNPDSFQIISAGPDMTWGQGGQWSTQLAPGYGQLQGQGQTTHPLGNGADDMCNFHPRPMGTP